MKMLVISFIVFLIIISIWFMFHFPYIDDVINDYSERLVEISNNVYLEQWDAVEIDLSNFVEDWGKIRKMWTYYLNQKDIDNIDISIKKLHIYIINKNKIMAQAEVEQLKVLFKIILENECIALDNIF